MSNVATATANLPLGFPSSTGASLPSELDGARRELVEAHLPLVNQVASRWRARCRTSLSYGDLLQVGSLALVEAARRYDPARCDSFAAYAHDRVRGAICDSLRALDPLSRRRRAAVRELEGAMADRAVPGAGEPDPRELASHLGWTLAAVEEARSDRAALTSGWAQTLETTDVAGEDDPFTALMESEARELLRDAIGELPERQQLVLSLYYVEELCLREIGEVLGVTESRVSQIRTAAIGALRSSMSRCSVGPAARTAAA
jgi:RNA polymerase sigma factor FliA